jgi:hypothetical protein
VTADWLRRVAAAHVRSIRFAIWAGLLVVATVVMAFVPVLNLLGFGFALFISFLSAVGASDLAAAFVRRLRAAEGPALERADTPGRAVAGIWLTAAATNLALLVPPLVLISLNAVRVPNCDWWFGLQAYLLMPGLSVLAGSAIGVACALIAGHRRGWSNALPYLVLIASAAVAVARFYGEPPVFIYNLYIGYWPGTAYDESIGFGAPFYWSRLLQLATLTSILAVIALALDVPELRTRLREGLRPDGFRLRPAMLAAIAAAVAASLWARSGDLGFAVDADEIQDALGGRHETEHFVIHYPRGGPIEKQIEIIGADHEFRYAQVSKLLDAELSGKIHSYYFADPDSKARWTGARRVHVAKPWRREIYVDHQPFPHSVLRHEIAHVVAAEFGDPIFGVSVRYHFGLPLAFNPGLIEGLAVAADWPDRRGGILTPHQSVKVMVELGLAPPIRRVLSPQFLAFSSARSYTVAGSFVRYILDRFGVDRLRALYRTGGDFELALGRDLGDVVADWRAMIEELRLPEGAVEIAREAFRRPGIVDRDCPIAIARRRGRVNELYAAGKVDEAARLMRRVCRDAPGEPTYQLTLAGLLDRAGQTDQATRIWTAIAGNAEQISSTLRVQAMLELTGPAFHRGDRAAVRDLLERAAELPLPEDLARNVAARRFALGHRGPAGDTLRRYFWGATDNERPDVIAYASRAAAMVIAEPELALGHYLFGRNMLDHGIPKEAAAELTRALDLGLPDPLLTRECARMLARAAYLAGDRAGVERAVGLLTAPEQPEAVRLRGAEWLERARWRDLGG